MQLIFSYYLNLNEILLFLTTFIKVQAPRGLLSSEIKKAQKKNTPMVKRRKE